MGRQDRMAPRVQGRVRLGMGLHGMGGRTRGLWPGSWLVTGTHGISLLIALFCECNRKKSPLEGVRGEEVVAGV